ncbi:MAG: YciE/YciF ferroxidase family protein [Tepidisphaeraceae bacterium]
MQIRTLEELLVHELRDLYSAERQIEKALPSMAKQAHHPKLREAFESHLKETENHCRRLERVATMLNFTPEGHTCVAMKGIIAEASDWLTTAMPHDIKDAGLISQAQRVEHYEMAGYGSARAFAQRLGREDVLRCLDQTLEEEKTADRHLTELALGEVNDDAAAANASRL